MKFTLGFSPCPNDTFIFDALVNKKIEADDLEFDVVLEDVETLNNWALQGKLDITKLSFPALFQSLNQYSLLHAGSALGKGVGPLLVGKEKISSDDVAKHSIAIPGIHTTANLLLSFAFPAADKKTAILFSDIEDAVVNGKAGLGVIIHENRFTYQQKGLIKIADLGNIWEEKMHVPIPLGGIAIKKSIDAAISKRINALIRQSLEYGFNNYPLISDYVKQHSQAMDENVMRKHIELYVNDYSIDLGDDGKNAIQSLYKVFQSIQHTNDIAPVKIFFV
ncbi:MAG TPA: 1,4-dihydroxy-6-naphthoate synthase [Chitinophagaceae bacterium]